MISLVFEKSGRDQWNSFVSGHERGHVMQSYEWGEVLKGQGWKPVRIAVVEDDKIEAAMALYFKKIPIVGSSIAFIPYGPVLDFDKKKQLECLVGKATMVAYENKALFLQLFPSVLQEDQISIGEIANRGFVKIEKNGILRLTQPLWVYKIDLIKPEKTLLENMKSKTRYNIKYSISKSVRVEEKNDIEHLTHFYAMLRENGKKKGFPVRGFHYFKNIWNQMRPSGLTKLFFAMHGENVLAAELAFVFGDTCYGMYRASSFQDRHLQASHGLVWGVMTWAKKNNCKWYDFRGVPSFAPPENHSGYGVFRFKEGFGGIPLTYAGDYFRIMNRKRYRLWETGEKSLNTVGMKILRAYNMLTRGIPK